MGKLDKNSLKESLSKQDIVEIMSQLGSPLKVDRGDTLIFETVCHNTTGGGSDKLYYYDSSKSFYCYTQCGSMDIYSVIYTHMSNKEGKEYSLPFALDFVSKFKGVVINGEVERRGFGFNYDLEVDSISQDWELFSRHKRINNRKTEVPIPKLSALDERVLNDFIPLPHKKWIEEGMSWTSQRHFQISYDQDGDKIVIPHFDIWGNLIGVRGRALNKEEEENFKYMPIWSRRYKRLLTHSLGSNLYGLYENKKAIERLETIIIFEGEKSVIKCQDYYGENNCSVAICGSSITPIQKELIKNSGAKRVYIALDKEYDEYGDESFLLYEEKVKRVIGDLSNYISVYVLWDYAGDLDRQDSPADKGKEVLDNLIKRKKYV